MQLHRWYKKSVIYLFPTSCLTVEVAPHVVMVLLGDIFLVPDRHNITRQIIAQSSTWIVRSEPHGRLVDMTSGVRVAYLCWCWEATYVTLFCVAPNAINLLFCAFFLSDIWPFQRKFLCRHARRLSCNNPLEYIESFDPSRPSLTPEDPILLLIGKIPSYLDAALKALTPDIGYRVYSNMNTSPCTSPPVELHSDSNTPIVAFLCRKTGSSASERLLTSTDHW